LGEIMRTKPLVTTLFVASLVVAAVASTHMLSQKDTGPKAYILATTMPLAQGTLLRAQDLTWQGVTETKPGAIVRPSASALDANPELENTARASVYGAVLRQELAAGEPILQSAIAKPGDRDFLQVVLTPGQRAIAIPVATSGASTGLLTPGDRVDVILTQNFKGDNTANAPLTRRSVSETVVENLRVLAIDAPDKVAAAPGRIAPAAVNPANGNFGRTVTLEVTPDQVEQINVAAELGKLTVALRSMTATTTASAVSRTDEGDPVVKPGQIVKPDQIVKPTDRVKPTWAGDVSPALYGAAQEKPLALTPPSVQVFHGAGKEQGNIRSETVKTEN
jgi:pilus assembly protein CpaB